MNSLTPGAGPDFELHSAQRFELRAYLMGGWDVARSLLDRATGSRGTFTGVVNFTETDDGGLRFREEGTMRWNPAAGTPYSGPASREYLLRPAARPDIMDMYFHDGRPFHRIGFGGQDRQDNRDSHWCDPDTYRVRYTRVGPAEFHYRWDVTGPTKDLLLESILHRTAGPGAVAAEATVPATVNPRIIVSAVCVFDTAGRLLTVRKRGTDKFMHPGGKPEAGETAAQAASRELAEEVGIIVPPEDLEPFGSWLAEAANEAATQIEATVFTAPGTWTAHASAEIAEIRWLDLGAGLPDDLAPLLTDHVLPLLGARTPRKS
ncbi:8-oxo-dGTP pyrophosphatase MutT (NUDIX family) [Arthrobacter sp. UYEF3]